MTKVQRALIVRQKMLPFASAQSQLVGIGQWSMFWDPENDLTVMYQPRALEVRFDGAWCLRMNWGAGFDVTVRTFKPGDWDKRLIALADAGAIVHRPSYPIAAGM
ncbi:MAG: hypothetical protein ABI240_14605 [Sphingomonas sp.]